jgi:hypothetical protein
MYVPLDGGMGKTPAPPFATLGVRPTRERFAVANVNLSDAYQKLVRARECEF